LENEARKAVIKDWTKNFSVNPYTKAFGLEVRRENIIIMSTHLETTLATGSILHGEIEGVRYSENACWSQESSYHLL